MKLAISNIAWPAAADAAVFEFLASRKVRGVEVAPTRLWPDWGGASNQAAAAYAHSLAAQNFQIPALQAILFAQPELQLFGDEVQRSALAEHLERVAALAAAFGAYALVFGAPKNRGRGRYTPAEAFSLARDFFRAVAPAYERLGVCLCLEANPAAYACDFVTDSREAARLVRAVGAPGFGLHLDTACLSLAGEEAATAIRDHRDILRHFHVSEPYLASFAAPTLSHAQIATVLGQTNYAGWVSLEMRAAEAPLAAVTQAVDYLTQTYGGDN